MIAWQQVFAPPLTIVSRPVSRGARTMAMTAPAMPAAASASQQQTREEVADALHVEYGLIRDIISKNRALTTRRMGPYFRAEVFHEPLIPRFSLATRENTDQSTVAENLSHTATKYWHSLLFTPEVEIPTAVKDTLKKFGVTEPFDDNVILTVGNFATMLKHDIECPG